MSNNLYMAFHPGDYLTDTAHLSTLEHGAYLLLIMNYWQRGEPLPADDRKLRGVARLAPSEWQDARETLLEFFTERDGLFHHKRIDEELERARAKSSKARASAEQSHGARKANAKRTHSESLAHQDQDKEQDKKEENTAARQLYDPAAAPLVDEKIGEDDLLRRCEQAVGLSGLKTFRAIIALVDGGLDVETRLLPILRDKGGELRRNPPADPPVSWNYFTKALMDLDRTSRLPGKAGKVDLVVLKRESPAWEPAAARHVAETGRQPLVVDGKSWFPAHMVAAPAQVAAA